ncbi:hypothetical protein PFISCL1PPCAC_27495, partial [Pristionchus fissidentatus]
PVHAHCLIASLPIIEMDFLYSWLSSLLEYLGLSKKSGKLIFLGLDNAGKTTLLHRLKDDRMGVHTPTLLPTAEELSLGSMRFLTYDLGGHAQARRVWKDYFPAVDAIVFLIDSTDHVRLQEARAELQSLLSDEMVAHAPIVVLGNKIDKAGAMSEEHLTWVLGVQHLRSGKKNASKDLPNRPFEVFMCSILMREGYGSAFRWISEYIN